MAFWEAQLDHNLSVCDLINHGDICFPQKEDHHFKKVFLCYSYPEAMRICNCILISAKYKYIMANTQHTVVLW